MNKNSIVTICHNFNLRTFGGDFFHMKMPVGLSLETFCRCAYILHITSLFSCPLSKPGGKEPNKFLYPILNTRFSFCPSTRPLSVKFTASPMHSETAWNEDFLPDIVLFKLHN